MNLPTFTAAKLNDFTVVGSYKHANEVATNTQDCITSTTTTAINMPKINTEDQLHWGSQQHQNCQNLEQSSNNFFKMFTKTCAAKQYMAKRSKMKSLSKNKHVNCFSTIDNKMNKYAC